MEEDGPVRFFTGGAVFPRKRFDRRGALAGLLFPARRDIV